MRIDEKVMMGISYFMDHTVPENSCIALEIEKIAKRMRIKKADMSQFRVSVYYGWRKIKNNSKKEEKDVEELAHNILEDYKLHSYDNHCDDIMLG